MLSLRKVKDEIRSLIRSHTKHTRNLRSIKELHELNETVFFSFAKKGIPLIYRGVARDWRFTRGGFDLLKKTCGNLYLNVRVGDYHRANKKLDFQKVLVRDYLANISKEEHVIGYAGYQIVPPKISQYLYYPKWFKSDQVEHPFHFWLGPKNTFTAIHSDTPDKLIYQCQGKKKWYLISPQYYHDLYIEPDFCRGYDTSPIDPRSPSDLHFPKFDYESILSIILNEGDLFFLPGGWYHAVESITPSLSFEYKSNPLPLSIDDNRIYSLYLEKIKSIKKNKL